MGYLLKNNIKKNDGNALTVNNINKSIFGNRYLAIIDANGNLKGTKEGSIQVSATSCGYALKGNGTSALYYEEIPVLQLGAAGSSVSIISIFSGTSSSGFLSSAGVSTAASGGYLSIQKNTSGSMKFAAADVVNNFINVNSSNISNANKGGKHCAIGTLLVSGATSSGKLYYDGALVGSATGTFSASSNYNRIASCGLRRSTSSSWVADNVSLTIICSPALTDSQARYVSENPGSLFQNDFRGGYLLNNIASSSASTFNSDGTSSALFDGSSLFSSVLSSTSTSAVSFTSQSGTSSLFSSISSASASFIGASLFSSLLAGNGSSAANFVSSIGGSYTLSIAGTSSAGFISSALFRSIFSANGASNASFVSSVGATGSLLSVSGVSSAAFVSSALLRSQFTAIGSSNAIFYPVGALSPVINSRYTVKGAKRVYNISGKSRKYTIKGYGMKSVDWFDSKRTDEIIKVYFDFSKVSPSIASLGSVGIVVNITVHNGTDLTPTNMLLNSPAVNGFIVTQHIQNGIDGNTYKISCSITSGLEIYILEGLLPVINPK